MTESSRDSAAQHDSNILAKETPPVYEHISFPDVSGLRTSAPGRSGWIAVTLASPGGITIFDIEKQVGAVSPQIVAAACWAILLSHYTPRNSADDSVDIAFQLLSHGTLRLHSTDSASLTWNQAISLLTLRDSFESDAPTTEKLSAISFLQIDAPSVQKGCPYEMLLCVQEQQGGLLEYTLSSPAEIHNNASATLLLEQYDSLFVAWLQQTSPSAFSPHCLPDKLRAGDNPAPQKIRLPTDQLLDQELFHHQFLRRARHSPGTIALDFRYDLSLPAGVSPNVSWSYQELKDRATALSKRLRNCIGTPTLGVDNIVALCLPKSPASYVAQLAVLMAGAAWCPIDEDWPVERKKALLAKSEALAVIVPLDTLSMREILPPGMTMLTVEGTDDTQDASCCEVFEPPLQSAALAYKIWTSGTTGLPKAVGIEHSAAVQSLRALQDAIPCGQEPVKYLQFSAYVFDLSILDCFYTWGLGGTLCACPRELLLTNLIEAANAFQATHSLLTPAVMAMTPRAAIPSLQVVINGGEKLTQVVADSWSDKCCLLNLYGPAEATLIAMRRQVPESDLVKAPNIGVALSTVSCHALDHRLQIVPKGCVGQLALGGHQCARGYIGDPAKTADKFVMHSTLGRVYMTGDLVRQLADGSFEYLGREDDQIKVNGIRIETLEISAVIRASHKLVKDSETQAIALDDSHEEEPLRIVNFSVLPQGNSRKHDSNAILRLDDEAASVARELRRAAQQKLPAYMVPSLFLIVDSFPRTSSAKIDRVALKKALAQLDVAEWESRISSFEASQEESHKAPVSATEAKLLTLISELCNLAPEKIGRQTPFPSLGLDSIKAMTLARKLCDVWQPVSVVDIVRHSSLLQLALFLDQSTASASTGPEQNHLRGDFLSSFDREHRSYVSEALRLDLSEFGPVMPTTPLQQGMLAETLHSGSQAAYWLNRVWRIDGDISLQTCASAMLEIFEANSACRIAFCEGNTAAQNASITQTFPQIFVQFCRSTIADHVAVIAKNEQPADWQDEMLQNAIAITGTNPTTTGRPPMAAIFAEVDSVKHLLLRTHHSIYDAHSLELLCQSFVTRVSGVSALKWGDISLALPRILPLGRDRLNECQQRWSEVLRKYPRGHAPPFPHLGSHIASEELSRRHDSISRMATVSWPRLSSTAQQMGTSARPIAQSAWASVMAAYLGTEWIMLGDSISGRALLPELENVFGPLHATLPVPTHVKRSLSRKELVDQVDEIHKAVLEHQHIPLSFVRSLLQLPPSESLFQTVFVLEATLPEERNATGEKVKIAHLRDVNLSVEHPIAIELRLREDNSIELSLYWRGDMMDHRHASMLLEQFDTSLSAFCQDLDKGALDWSSDFFPPAQLSISHTSAPSDTQRAAELSSIESWLAHVSKADPNRVALEFWSSFSPHPQFSVHTLTYRDLSLQAGQLATILARSVPQGSVVAVCLRRCVYTYLALLATQLSGNIYLPIDENLPSERQLLLARDSGSKCIITEEYFAEAFRRIDCAAMLVDSASFTSMMSHATPWEITITKSPDDIAYILYTSGSTGTPKGCQLSRRNLAVAIESFRLVFEKHAPGSLDRETRFLARSAEAFDVALLEIFLPLRTGGTIVTAPRHAILEDLKTALSVGKITHAAVVPSLFFSKGKRIQPADVPELRVLVVGGELLASDIVATWGSAHAPLLNAYGPTEATIGSSIARVTVTSSVRNIGRPFPATTYMVVHQDASLQELSPTLKGEAGELCILGPQVGSGYLGRSNASTFGIYDGMQLYRTGDLARMTADGKVIYLGRADDSQVKIRGARLELREIDAALVASSSSRLLHACSVLDRNTHSAEGTIVSFVAHSTDANGALALDEVLEDELPTIRQSLRKTLPMHMLPTVIVPLKHLPLASISGKIDSKALKTAYAEHLRSELFSQQTFKQRTRSRHLDTKAQSFIDEMVKVLPSQIATNAVKLDDDIFALGLDSLSAITLAGRLRARAIDIRSSDLLRCVTVKDAIELSRSASSPVPSLDVPTAWEHVSASSELIEAAIEAGINEAKQMGVKIYPCVPLQTALVAQSLADSQGRYVSVLQLTVAEATDPKRLRKAVDSTIARHSIWRTAFPELKDGYCQLVYPPERKAKWVEHESELSASSLIARIGIDPPVQFCIENASGRSRLTILVHHALYDGITVDLFKDDVQRCYLSSMEKLPNYSSSFAQIAQTIARRSVATAQDFWTRELHDSTFTPFPNLSLRNHKPSMESREACLTADLSLSQLSSLAQKLKVTPQALVLAAFSTLYAQYTGEADSIFGLVLSGRTLDAIDTSHVHGPLVTTVPFRTHHLMEPFDRPKQVKMVHDHILAIYPEQHVSLSQLGHWLQLERQLFNTLFSFLPTKDRNTATNHDVDSLFVSVESSMATEYPLAVEIQPDEEGALHLRIVYDPHLVPPEQATLLLQQLNLELLKHLANPVQPAADAVLAIEPPRRENPEQQLPSFLALFHEQVEYRPDAIAIDFASQGLDEPFDTLTYERLDHWSSYIAEKLLLQRSEVVGVYLSKSLLFYATLIAVWKAGKVYLPLDPSLPLERLKYMSSIASVDCVVADERTLDAAKQLGKAPLLLRSTAPSPSRSILNGTKNDIHRSKIAYILFTSGSTGKPKAVAISHEALAAAIESWRNMLPYDNASRMLQLASSSFDVSLIEICMPLALGFAVASAPKDILLEDLEETFCRLRLTMADLPASLAPSVRPNAVPRLHWLMSGGDAIDERVIKEWAPHGLINAWGPTEATIGNTLGFVQPDYKRSIVGHAYPTSGIYVLRPGTTEVAYRGCIGELAVSGVQLAEEYLGSPQLTQAAFKYLADGTRIYLTGDRGRILYDGTVEVLGRLARGQVKLRGQRLELDEVSHAFRVLSQIQDAATLYVKHPDLPAQQLVTWIVGQDNAALKSPGVSMQSDQRAVELVRRSLDAIEKSLPGYMIPSHVLVVSGSLPLTPNNKTDHKALMQAFIELDITSLQAFGERINTSAPSERTWSPAEKLLRSLVAEHCQVEEAKISQTTSFYHLGVDSISSIKLARKMRSHGLNSIVASDLLRWPSVGLLAANITTKQREDSFMQEELAALQNRFRSMIVVEQLRLTPNDVISDVLPCTPLQESMIDQSVASQGALYIHHHIVRLNEQVTFQQMSEAWQQVVGANGILRTSFHRNPAGPGWIQATHSEIEPSMRLRAGDDWLEFWKDLTSAASLWHEDALARIPIRCTLAHVKGDKRMLISLHHALYDGNTLPQLLDDLDMALDGRKLQSRPQFCDLLPYLLSRPENEEHWAAMIRGVAVKPPSDSTAPSLSQAIVQVPLLLSHAHDAAKRLSVSVRSVAVLALAKVLARQEHTSVVVMGQIFALRDSIEGAEQVLGPAFNTLPVKVDLRGDQTTASLVRDFQRRSDEGRAHRAASLKSILRRSSMIYAPFDTLMDFQISSEISAAWRNFDLEDIPVGHGLDDSRKEYSATQYPLNVEFRQKSDGFEIYATAASTSYTDESLHDLLIELSTVFVQILDDQISTEETHSPETPGVLDSTAGSITQGGSGEQHVYLEATQETDERLMSLEKVILSCVTRITQASPCSLSHTSPLVHVGIDSISALRLAALLRQSVGIPRFGVSDVVEGGSIRGIAKVLAQKGQCASDKVYGTSPSGTRTLEVPKSASIALQLNIAEHNIETVLPALSGQMFHLATWITSGKKLGMYSFAWSTKDGCIDADRLQRAWASLCTRNAVLRTTFAFRQGCTYQVVLTGPNALPNVAVDQISEDLDAHLRDAVRGWAAKPLDSNRPAAQLRLLSTSSRSVALLQLSHMLYDAESLRLLAAELQQLYRKGGAFVSRTTDFFDFVRYTLRSEASNAREFWERELKDVRRTLVLPDAAGRNLGPFTQVYEPEAFTLPTKGLQGVQNGGRTIPIQYLFMAAWVEQLAGMARIEDGNLVFGLYVAGRSLDYEGVDSVNGPCMNVLPVQASVSPQSLYLRAGELQDCVQRRVPFEQSDPAEIQQWLGDSEQLAYDAFLNMIWGSADVQETNTELTGGSGEEDWQELNLAQLAEESLDTPGSVQDTSSVDEVKSPNVSHGLSEISAETLAAYGRRSLDVDIVLQQDRRHVGLAVGCDAKVMDRDQALQMIRVLVERVAECWP